MIVVYHITQIKFTYTKVLHESFAKAQKKMIIEPTPVLELNQVLEKLLAGISEILHSNFLGAYLGGSYAHGGWDLFSDVDFNVVIDHDLTDDDLAALTGVHTQIFAIDSYYAHHLEGSYFPKDVLADNNRTNEPVWYLDNGSLTFERSTHDNSLVNRWVLREHGVRLAGPVPEMWIPVVPVSKLKNEIRHTLITWGNEILEDRYLLDNRWAQFFTVLMYCRMLHSLATGRVGSKPSGAEWAKAALDARWIPLIDDALSARPNQYQKYYEPPNPELVRQTKAFVRFAIRYASARVDPDGLEP